MTVDTNNIAALRKALEQTEALRETIDSIALDDWVYRQITRNLSDVETSLTYELKQVEKVLVDSFA